MAPNPPNLGVAKALPDAWWPFQWSPRLRQWWHVLLQTAPWNGRFPAWVSCRLGVPNPKSFCLRLQEASHCPPVHLYLPSVWWNNACSLHHPAIRPRLLERLQYVELQQRSWTIIEWWLESNSNKSILRRQVFLKERPPACFTVLYF